MRFVPAGETAGCYQLTDERGGRWFLKLGRPGAIEGPRAEFALQLCDAWPAWGWGYPGPRPTQSGELWCWLNGLRVVVFECVDSQPLSDQDLGVPEVARQTARLIAAVHAATPALAIPVPVVEEFEVWADGLRRCLAELKPDASAGGLRGEARGAGVATARDPARHAGAAVGAGRMRLPPANRAGALPR